MSCDKIPIWQRDEAILFCRYLSVFLVPCGYVVALTGSVLIKGESFKDLDIVVFPMSSKEFNIERLYVGLRMAGLSQVRDVKSMHAGWRSKGLSDEKHVEVWSICNKRVDFLILK